MNTTQRAVIYDADPERSAQLAALVQRLGYRSLVVDHLALVTTVLHSSGSEQVLLIGDANDSPDWQELGTILAGPLCDVPVLCYGSRHVADELGAVTGAQRISFLRYPFTPDQLTTLLHQPVLSAPQETGTTNMPTGVSAAVRQVNRLIKQVAAHGSSVLVLGESGTGKELVARAIHEASPRRQRPFVAINCGAIPSELLESELFGHEKGSFTGAVSARKGRFEIADGGTLFLDEIGDMSMTMQVKLLRVLQERVFERVGSHTPIRCNVRIIAATHRNLEESIANGSFREDLFYRLNVFPIDMPPLRERREDLAMLVRDFIGQNVTNGRAAIQFRPRVIEALMQYNWPGNVRELGNLIERLSILCPHGMVDIADLPPRYRPQGWQPEPVSVSELLVNEEVSEADEITPESGTETLRTAAVYMADEEGVLADEQAMLMLDDQSASSDLAFLPSHGLDLRSHLYEIERGLIRQAMERTGGTVAHAARLLQLRRTTLVEKLRKFEMLNEPAASEL